MFEAKVAQSLEHTGDAEVVVMAYGQIQESTTRIYIHISMKIGQNSETKEPFT